MSTQNEFLQEEKADIIGLSGLITPSLDEMVTVAKRMQERKLKARILVFLACEMRFMRSYAMLVNVRTHRHGQSKAGAACL